MINYLSILFFIFSSILVTLGVWYFELDSRFFKDYGPAIGPSVAIVLFFIKHWYDESSENRKVRNELARVKTIIQKSLPPKFVPKKGDTERFFNFSNSSNITIYYQRVSLIKKCVDDIYDNRHSAMNDQEMIQFSTVKWWADFLLKEIEDYREEGKKITTDLKSQESEEDFISYLDRAEYFLTKLKLGHENLENACGTQQNYELKYSYPEEEAFR